MTATMLAGTAYQALVEGDKLLPADVILVHTKRAIGSWLIRLGTRGHFNHAGMVFVRRDPGQGYKHTFIIESTSGAGGVDIDKIEKYLTSSRTILGVKRLDEDWFTQEYRRRARGFALEEIQNHYDHRMIRRIIRQVARATVIGLVMPFQRRKPQPRIVGPRSVMAYICSGLVAAAYYRTVQEMDPTRLTDVTFAPGINTYTDILATTPEDLARSPKLKWQYAIRDNVAWQVQSYNDVLEVMR